MQSPPEKNPIFDELEFKKSGVIVKNRIFRSSISGRIDNYDGSGTQARINWEERFARGGVGAIISSHVPVHIRGRILPNYAMIDNDDKIPFWRAVGKAVHRHGCKFILQLSHSGRQQDMGGVENLGRKAWSATSRSEPLHGIPCQAMEPKDIQEVIQWFADGAGRAQEAGLDGVELHSANGYLFTQFLSSAINDRTDGYGGPLENRARFLMEVIKAIRKKVGDFHLQAKISAVEHHLPYFQLFDKKGKGNTIEDSIQICKWVENPATWPGGDQKWMEEWLQGWSGHGADAIHVSTGASFAHPLNPAGKFPFDEADKWYDAMLSSGDWRAFWLVYLSLRFRPLHWLFRLAWFGNLQGELEGRRSDENLITKKELEERQKDCRRRVERYEGISVHDAYAIKQAVQIPVISTGGYQNGFFVRQVLEKGYCDAVAIARPLIANPDLPEIWKTGADLPKEPCSYCNKCLLNVIENPLGCYDIERYKKAYGDKAHDKMIEAIMEIFQLPPSS